MIGIVVRCQKIKIQNGSKLQRVEEFDKSKILVFWLRDLIQRKTAISDRIIQQTDKWREVEQFQARKRYFSLSLF